MKILGTLLLIGATGATYVAYKNGLFNKVATTSTPAGTTSVLDEAIDVAIEKIKASSLYTGSGATKRLAIDSVLSTVASNDQAKQNLKIYSDHNSLPLETAITTQLLPTA